MPSGLRKLEKTKEQSDLVKELGHVMPEKRLIPLSCLTLKERVVVCRILEQGVMIQIRRNKLGVTVHILGEKLICERDSLSIIT